MSPLTDLLKGMKEGKKTRPFEFPAGAIAAFAKLKEAFTTAPILVHFNPKKPILIETDASGFALGAVLSQQGADDSTAH